MISYVTYLTDYQGQDGWIQVVDRVLVYLLLCVRAWSVSRTWPI